MTDPYFLKCLGYPELSDPAGRPVRIRVKKHMALLTFLAVERDTPHERGRLVELLWPRTTESRGRHSCATALSQLRTIFGRDAFISTRTTVRFKPAGLVLDADYLSDDGIFGQDGESRVEPDGFLRGFDIDDAPEFSLWREREYAQRLPATHRGLLRLIDHGRRRGSHDEIMKWAERLLSLDHLAEEGIRAKMEALALVGDRISAIRVFDEWKGQIGDELSAHPSLAVDGMASQLRRRGWEPNEPNARPAVPTEQWRDRPFVGRRAEYRTLYETWEQVHQHHPRHFLIAGDSGVGKTTLAQRLVTAAGLEGASVSRVQCYQLEHGIPYAAVGGLIAGLVGRPGLVATAPDALAEVAKVVPLLRSHFTSLPGPKPSEGDAARLLFTEGVIDLLRAVINERPLLLVVDDVHCADEASLAVLHLVMRRICSGRFLIALTMRLGEDASPVGYRLLEAADRLPIETIQLDPLSKEESRELVDALFRSGGAPSAPERNALLRTAKGLPMVLELLVDDWRAHGHSSVALAIFAMTSGIRAEVPNTRDPYYSLARRLLASLSPSARQVLVLAAVQGSQIGDIETYALAGLTQSQAIEGLADLCARRVLRDVGGETEFVNDLLRAHVYREIPAATRTRLHEAIAEHATSSGRRQSEFVTAWHLMRAGRTETAAEHLLAGAAEALTRGAPDEVILTLQSAIPEIPNDRREEATLLLVEALHELGRWKDGLDRLSQIDPEGTDERSFIFRAEAQWRLGVLHHDNPREVIERLIELALPCSRHGARSAQLAALIAGSFQETSLLTRLRGYLAEAGTEKIPGYRTAQSIAAYYCRDLAVAEAEATEALAQLTSAGAGGTQVLLLEIGLGAIASSQGQYENSAYRHHRATEQAEAIDNDRMRMQAIAGRALALLRLGRFADVLDLSATTPVESALYRNPTIGVSVATLEYASCCALALLDRKAESVQRLSTEGLTELDMCAQDWMRQVWGFYKADIFWLAGNRKRALAEATATVATAPDPLSKGVIGSLCRWRSLTARMRLRSVGESTFFSEQVDRVADLDRIDQLEVLLSAVHSRGGRNEVRNHTILERARMVAAELPPPAVDFIYRFFGKDNLTERAAP